MIFLDSNVVLRYGTRQREERTRLMHEQASALIDAAKTGRQTVTLSEVVLHESCYVMASKHHYGAPPEEVADFLTAIIELPGMRLPPGEKSVYLRALEIYRRFPKLELSDALIAARAEQLGAALATFDRALGRLPFVTGWEW